LKPDGLLFKLIRRIL